MKLDLGKTKEQLERVRLLVGEVYKGGNLKDPDDLSKLRQVGMEIVELQEKLSSAELELTLEALEAFNQNVAGAEKNLAFSKKLRTRQINMSGEDSPAYKKLDIEYITEAYKEGFSIDEIAAEIGVSGYTVRERLKRAGLYKDGRRKERKI